MPWGRGWWGYVSVASLSCCLVTSWQLTWFPVLSLATTEHKGSGETFMLRNLNYFSSDIVISPLFLLIFLCYSFLIDYFQLLPCYFVLGMLFVNFSLIVLLENLIWWTFHIVACQTVLVLSFQLNESLAKDSVISVLSSNSRDTVPISSWIQYCQGQVGYPNSFLIPLEIKFSDVF